MKADAWCQVLVRFLVGTLYATRASTSLQPSEDFGTWDRPVGAPVGISYGDRPWKRDFLSRFPHGF